MTLDLPPDPSLKDLTLPWEAQYWYKAKCTWTLNSKWFAEWMKFFGDDRKPRDIFRSDVAAFRTFLRKKGWSEKSIARIFEAGSHLYNWLGELELVEEGFNPFLGMAPKRIKINVQPHA